jgi:hypothetical protein
MTNVYNPNGYKYGYLVELCPSGMPQVCWVVIKCHVAAQIIGLLCDRVDVIFQYFCDEMSNNCVGLSAEGWYPEYQFL